MLVGSQDIGLVLGRSPETRARVEVDVVHIEGVGVAGCMAAVMLGDADAQNVGGDVQLPKSSLASSQNRFPGVAAAHSSQMQSAA